MVQSTTASKRTAADRVQAKQHTWMAVTTTDNGKMTKNMVLVNSNTSIKPSTMGSGRAM